MDEQECMVDNGQIDKFFWESSEWIEFYTSNLDIMDQIVKVFNQNKYKYSNYIRLSSQFIANSLDIENKYVHHMLTIWYKHHCSFYKKYGRVIYDKRSREWNYYNKNPTNT